MLRPQWSALFESAQQQPSNQQMGFTYSYTNPKCLQLDTLGTMGNVIVDMKPKNVEAGAPAFCASQKMFFPQQKNVAAGALEKTSELKVEQLSAQAFLFRYSRAKVRWMACEVEDLLNGVKK